jgi:hypothetical protein
LFFTVFTVCFFFFRNIYINRNKKETRENGTIPIKSIVFVNVSSFSILFIDICNWVGVKKTVSKKPLVQLKCNWGFEIGFLLCKNGFMQPLRYCGSKVYKKEFAIANGLICNRYAIAIVIVGDFVIWLMSNCCQNVIILLSFQ